MPAVSAALASLVTNVAIRVVAEERVQEVARQRLRADLVVARIEVDRLLQAESVDALQTLTLILDLLRVREVRERQAAVIQHRAALLLLARAELVEVRHRVRLRDLVLGELVQIRLHEGGILTVLALGPQVVEAGRHRRFLLRQRGVVRVELVRRGVLSPLRLGRHRDVAEAGGVVCAGLRVGLDLVADKDLRHLGEVGGEAGRLLREAQGLLMLIELGEHGAELEDEAAVEARQVDRPFEDLPRRPALIRIVALQPVLHRHLHLLCFLLVVPDVLGGLAEEVVVAGLHVRRLPLVVRLA